jgi:hypothetical protein
VPALLSPLTQFTPGIGGAICAIASSIIVASTCDPQGASSTSDSVAGTSIAAGGGEVMAGSAVRVSVNVVVTGAELSVVSSAHPVMSVTAAKAVSTVPAADFEIRALTILFIEQILSLPTHSYRRNQRRKS